MSLSYNGYLYVHGNPVNLTDPSGQIIPIVAILLGAAAGAAISTALEVGSQMLQGRSIDCLDMGSVGRAALEGAVMGGIGGGVGAVLKTAVKAGQITRRAAALYSAAADISTGVIWDMAVYQTTPSDALVRNVVSFGVGTAVGAASQRLLRSAKGIGRWLRGADDDVARAMRQAGDSGGMRTARRAGAEAQVDLSQRRVWADNPTGRPDLSSVDKQLREILEKPDYYFSNPKGLCYECANAVGNVLKANGFVMDIAQVQSASFRGSQLYVHTPTKDIVPITSMGWHEVATIKVEGVDYFLDSLSYNHSGLTPLTRAEYASLWAHPEMLAYFHARSPSPNINTGQLGRIAGPNDILGDLIHLGTGTILNK